MKRFVLVASLAVLVLGAVPAFSQQEPPPGRIVIEFWNAFRGALGDILQKLVNEFNASQDKYWVSYVFKGSYTETMNAAIAAAQAGSTLVDSTTRAAIAYVGMPSAVAATEAIILAEGVLKNMMLTKIKIAATLFLALGLLGSATGWLLMGMSPQEAGIQAVQDPNVLTVSGDEPGPAPRRLPEPPGPRPRHPARRSAPCRRPPARPRSPPAPPRCPS
ncbi:MAG: hypothetical protein ACK42E_00390, partial [Candidatus Bipolaricaulaceae bacterium]